MNDTRRAYYRGDSLDAKSLCRFISHRYAFAWEANDEQGSELALDEHALWYKVEFEGKIGYISRYFRKVLRGNCG
ncbi:MAG: hypothetical protein OXE52_00275 [Chloroflexi bacterium]|nr:hypothetical protein [Chloroflexota bacterium]